MPCFRLMNIQGAGPSKQRFLSAKIPIVVIWAPLLPDNNAFAFKTFFVPKWYKICQILRKYIFYIIDVTLAAFNRRLNKL